MAEFVTLYSYSVNEGHSLRTVIRSTLDPTFIDFYDVSSGGGGPKPPDNVILSVICQPGTFDRYTYKTSSLSPFASVTKEANSPFCGYTPPACDIVKVSFVKTDETDIGANDGTANLFCTSSFGPITYMLSPPLPDPPIFNTTGYFTGLVPSAAYYINAVDANGCSIHQDFEILAFSSDRTHFKYRLQFGSANHTTDTPEIAWELQLYDQLHSYLKTEYPKDITGTDDPVVIKTEDPNEDKFSPIIAKQLTANLYYTGLDFEPDEFSLAPEQSWYVQLLRNGEIEFKGYLLPDEIQNLYADAPYPITLLATDGLPSLKGNIWGNGSGGSGYGTLQIQQYGLTKWCFLVKQCLDQLGYNYGEVHIVSSLRFNSLYATELWHAIGTWSDILYDSSGVGMSTYDALALLLTGMKLSIFQHNGEFYLVNWNDLAYINNGVVAVEFARCFYRFNHDFTAILNEEPNLDFQIIGFDAPFKPVNLKQAINYDKPYNIENDVALDHYALLYENPSFEIGAVQGDVPSGFNAPTHGLAAYCNYDPVTEDPNSGAPDGSWELKVEGGGDTMDNYISTDAIPIDQPNKQLNISFDWKPGFSSGTPNPGGIVFSFAAIFVAETTSQGYFLQTSPTWALSLQDYLAGGHTAPTQPTQTQWTKLSSEYYSEGDAVSVKGYPTQDIIGWGSYNIQSPILPEGGIGNVYIRWYGAKFQYYDQSGYPALPAFQRGMYADLDAGSGYYLVDKLDITLSEAGIAYNVQTGEKHLTTAVTGIPNANLKQADISLFTFPTNKRVAGNIFTTDDYLTGVVANTWGFAMKPSDKLDRLAAIVAKAYARQYNIPYHKFEGDVETAYMPYWAVYGLRFYEGRLFMPWSIEGHLRSNVWSVVLIEISDSDAQVVYQYVPEYQRNARQN